MPHKSAEQLKQKTAALKKKLTEKAASMDPVKVRKAKRPSAAFNAAVA